jgi:hypothetical protein
MPAPGTHEGATSACKNCGEALEGITHSDSRLWRTLRLLCFKPG